MFVPSHRPRRLRQNFAMRALLRETQLSVQQLVMPLFIKSGEGIKQPITSMPGQYQLSLDKLPAELLEIKNLGIPAVLLFGLPSYKDEVGSSAWQDDGIIAKAISVCKEVAPEILVIADVCFCEYTSHGHCGVLSECGQDVQVDNDATLENLAKQAVCLAQAGADIIAPSGMMDGMVGAIREALDENDFSQTPILSYAVKYASAFYGPFREAAEGAPQKGDRNTYQMDPANANEALKEAELDVQEGADMLMVKPAIHYLDIIFRLKMNFPQIPLAAYHVSGEYAMLKAAGQNGWLNEEKAMLESLLAIKRAGADVIITYYAKEAALLLKGNNS